MKAYRMLEWQKPPELVDVPVPEPGPGEVLVRIAAAGACHSDLHLMEWPEGTRPYSLPFTLGHENTGWVAALGFGAEGFIEGDAVAVYGPWGCGVCRACRESRENYCERGAQLRGAGCGLGIDGGMAEYLLVPSTRVLMPLHGLDPVATAPLTDAALTPYHAIKRSLPLLGAGTSTVVIGVGGLGHMAVQLLKAVSGSKVIAVDLDPDKLAFAAEVGADVTLPASTGTADAVRDLTRGLGADLVLDFVGLSDTIALAASLVRVQGAVTVVGAGGGDIRWWFRAFPFEVSLTSVYWGSAVELMEVLELARSGKVRTHVQTFPLDRVGEAYAALREGRVRGRAVITP